MTIRLITGWILFALATIAPLHAQNSFNPDRVQLANLQQDVQLLRTELLNMRQRIERLEAENVQLKTALINETKARNEALNGFASSAQLAREVSALKAQYASADAAQTKEILAQLNATLDAFAKQTESSLQLLASRPAQSNSGSSNPAPPVPFSDDFPKTGVEYIVQPGDTLSGIASRFGSTVSYIQSANKISRPTALQVGQKLFIPQD